MIAQSFFDIGSKTMQGMTNAREVIFSPFHQLHVHI